MGKDMTNFASKQASSFIRVNRAQKNWREDSGIELKKIEGMEEVRSSVLADEILKHHPQKELFPDSDLTYTALQSLGSCHQLTSLSLVQTCYNPQDK
ncbi:hypothetical protein YC2023_065420 [Brassica napus]